MKRATLLAFVHLVFLLLLSGCSPAPQDNPDVSVAKEASAKGTRICFSSRSSLPISASFTGKVVSQNASRIQGQPGVLTSGEELCFAGYRSFIVNRWDIAENAPRPKWGETETDVAVAIAIDGEYSALSFFAWNQVMMYPSLHWTDDMQRQDFWGGGWISVGESFGYKVAGHSFSITRRPDSDNFIELAVRFS